MSNSKNDMVLFKNYAGERIYRCGSKQYFIKDHDLFTIDEQGVQEWIFSHQHLLQAFYFHQQGELLFLAVKNESSVPKQYNVQEQDTDEFIQMKLAELKSRYPHGFQSILIYNLAKQEVVQEVIVPEQFSAFAQIAVSHDLQMLAGVTCLPQNKLALFRIVKQDELFLLTDYQLPKPTKIDAHFQPSNLMASALLSPWNVLDFAPESNQHILLLSRYEALLSVVQFVSSYTFLTVRKLGTNFRRNLPENYNRNTVMDVLFSKKVLFSEIMPLQQGHVDWESQILNTEDGTWSIETLFDNRTFMNQILKSDQPLSSPEKIEVLPLLDKYCRGEINMVTYPEYFTAETLVMNQKIQRIIDQIPCDIALPKKFEQPKITNPREYVNDLLANGESVENLLQHVDLTGEFQWINNDICSISCRNFGIILFKIPKYPVEFEIITEEQPDGKQAKQIYKQKFPAVLFPPSPRFCLLDIDYNFVVESQVSNEKISQMTDFQLCLGDGNFTNTTQNFSVFDNVLFNHKFLGDRRLISFSFDSSMQYDHFGLVCGFGDSSLKWYLLRGESLISDDIVKPQYSQFYSSLGPVRRITFGTLTSQSAHYNGVDSNLNNVFVTTFTEGIYLMPTQALRENSKFTALTPHFITQIIPSITLNRINLRTSFIKSLVSMRLLTEFQSEQQSSNKQELIQLCAENINDNDIRDLVSQVVSEYVLQILDRNDNDFRDLQRQASNRGCLTTLQGDEGKQYIIFATADSGRLYSFNKTGNSQVANYVTSRLPLSILDQKWYLPDPVLVLESLQECKLIITGHASGYVRFWHMKGDGSLRMINRIKLSNLPIVNLCIIPNGSLIITADTSCKLYFISGIQNDCIFQGYLNIRDTNNLMPVDLNSNLLADTQSMNEYVNQKFNKLIFSLQDVLSDLKTRGISKEQLSANFQSIKLFSQNLEDKKNEETMSLVANYIRDKESLSETQIETFCKLVKPLSTPFYDKFVPHYYQHVISIKATWEGFYVALSTGDIIKYQYINKERFIIMKENIQTLEASNFREYISQSSNKELELTETKFLQMVNEARISPSDLKPFVIHTMNAISTIAIDPCIIPPPCIMTDLIYVGLHDGRVFCYQIKSISDDVQQIQNLNKTDFPLTGQNPIISLTSSIAQIQISVDGILLITDGFGNVVITHAITPQIQYLNTLTNTMIKSDDLQQNITQNDIVIPNLTEVNSKMVMYDSISKYFKQQRKEDFIQVQFSDFQSVVRLHKVSNQTNLLVVNQFNDIFEMIIPSDFIQKSAAKIIDVEQSCKAYVSKSLQIQSTADGSQQSKAQLRMTYDTRFRNRQPSLVQDEIQAINQQLIQTSSLVDGPLDDKHQYQVYPAQHFSFKSTIELSQYLYQNSILGHIEAVEEYDTTKTAEYLKSNIQKQMDKINLMSLPFNQDVAFESCGRLVALVISSHLRSRINAQLIEESQKIAESCKQIDIANEKVLQARSLIVVPETNNVRYLEKINETNKEDPNSKFEYQNIKKLLNASSRLTENELRICQNVSNSLKSKFMEELLKYEKAYKQDILAAMTYLYQLIQDRIMSKSIDNTQEAVSGILDPQTYVSEFPYPSSAQLLKKKAKHAILLRSSQIASERLRSYAPPALVKQQGATEAERKFKVPTEKESEMIENEYQGYFVATGYQQHLEKHENLVERFKNTEKFEDINKPIDKEDPFHLINTELAPFEAGTLLKVHEMATDPIIRAQPVPFSKLPVIYQDPDTEIFIQKNMSQIPGIRHLITHGSVSLRKALFNETEVAFNIRAKQQYYLLHNISLLVVQDINSQMLKTHQSKLRTLTKIQETVQQIKEISKELIYHAKEETLQNMITKTRERLFEEMRVAGVSIEEAAQKSSKGVIAALPSDDEIVEAAMKLLDMELLDISTIIGSIESNVGNGKESIVYELGFDPINNPDQKNKKDSFLNILKQIAVSSTLEKLSSTLVSFADQIKVNDIQKNEPLAKALKILSDEGLFNVQHLSTLIKKKKEELSQDNADIDPDVIKMAMAYQRALYDMMRGSIDASNRVTVRDINIPTTLGLNEKAHKLSKEQVTQNEAYLARLLEIEEQRQKEKKSLNAQCMKLREQAGELSKNFDQTVLFQLRNKRFNAEILIQTLQLSAMQYINRMINYAQNNQKFSNLQDIKLANEELVVRMEQHLEHISQLLSVESQRKLQFHRILQAFQTRIIKNELKECNQVLIQFIKKPSDVLAIREKIQKLLQQLDDAQELNAKEGLNMQNLINVSLTGFSNYYQKEGELEAIHKEVLLVQDDLVQNLVKRQVMLKNKEEVVQSEAANKITQKQPLVNIFGDFVFPSGLLEEEEKLQHVLRTGDVNVVYAQLISKLIPVNTIQELQTGSKINFHTADAQVFDCCRCFKTVLEIQQYECGKRSEMLQYYHDSLLAVVNMVKSKQEQFLQVVSEFSETMNDQFINVPSVSVFSMGQLEYARSWEQLIDKMKLVFDNEVIGQSETRKDMDENEDLLVKDDSLFLVVERQLVDQLNDELTNLGKQRLEKLEVLAREKQAQRCLQHSVNMKEWDQNDVVASTKDFQMIRVSKEMHDIIRENSSTVEKKSKEVNIMTHKLEHSRKSHGITMGDRDTQLKKVPAERRQLELQNQILQQKIEDLRAKNEQRKQALPDYAQAVNQTQADADDAQKKFRRIAALRKMRELSKAQEEEMQFLIGELDKLRQRTYPTFE